MPRARQDLVDEALANLGIIQQADASATRTSNELVTEALGNLGLNQQTYSGGTHTRADLVTEALANLGLVQAAYSGSTRTRADWVTEALANLGIIQQTYAGLTRTRAQLVSDAMAALGVVQKSPTVSAGTRTQVELVSQVLFNLGALGEGNTVPTADATNAVHIVATNKARELEARQVVTIADTNAIDNGYFLPFATIVTEAIKEQYGVDADTTEAAGLIADARQAELDLKIMTRATLADSKIDAIAADLRARAVATLTVPVVTVPEPYYSALVLIVANEVKGYFDWLGADVASRATSDAQAAEIRLRTISGTALVDEIVDATAAELKARAVVALTVPVVTVPEQYFPALSIVLADQVKGKFPWVAADIATRIPQERGAAEIRLRILSGASLIDGDIDTVTADLVARSIVTLSVPVVTVPDQYFQSLASIVADNVKGKFPWLPAEVAQRAESDAADAELRLRQINAPALVSGKLPSIFGELNARGIATISNPNAIPGAWFPALADIVAENVRGKFIVQPDIAERVMARATLAERTLKNLTRTYLVSRNIDSIMSDLAAREIVYLVDNSAIPDEWFTHLAWIVADRSKSKYELDPATIQVAATEGQNAIMMLREMTRGRPSYLPLRTAFM